MKLKSTPEDFIVEELFDINNFIIDTGNYHYFLLTKTNYTQIRAIEVVSRVFKVSTKNIHFSGTKDKVGITKQYISIFNPNLKTLENNINFLNERIKDIEIEYLGRGEERINLGSHNGNKFTVLIRDLDENDIEKAKTNLPNIKEKGVLNLFDTQRFGFSGNSHEIGAYILKNDLEMAVKLILTAIPSENASENIINFANEVEKSWEEIKKANDTVINEIVKVAPKFMKNEVNILRHLQRYKNDFPGAFRTIHKKLRTLYFNAYQSYIFNETIKSLDINSIDKDLELPLILSDTIFPKEIQEIVDKLIEKDKVNQEMFKLPSMPELVPSEEVTRNVISIPKNLEIIEEGIDELNENKKKITVAFELKKGEYATNIVKQLFL